MTLKNVEEDGELFAIAEEERLVGGFGGTGEPDETQQIGSGGLNRRDKIGDRFSLGI